jgi:hypothetical protein
LLDDCRHDGAHDVICSCGDQAETEVRARRRTAAWWQSPQPRWVGPLPPAVDIDRSGEYRAGIAPVRGRWRHPRSDGGAAPRANSAASLHPRYLPGVLARDRCVPRGVMMGDIRAWPKGAASEPHARPLRRCGQGHVRACRVNPHAVALILLHHGRRCTRRASTTSVSVKVGVGDTGEPRSRSCNIAAHA